MEDNNAGTGLCGVTTWRVPTIDELETLLHLGRAAPLIDSDLFPNTVAEPYWSAFPHATATANSWALDFATGQTQSETRETLHRVRLVSDQWGRDSAGAAAAMDPRVNAPWLPNRTPLSRYRITPSINAGNGTVFDLHTGLMWTRCTLQLHGDNCEQGFLYYRLSWDVMIGHASTLSVGGHTDWRMPNLKELRSIIPYDVPCGLEGDDIPQHKDSGSLDLHPRFRRAGSVV